MIYKLDLPKPSEKLINSVMQYTKQSKVNLDTLKWHQSIQNSNVNCAYGDFFTKPDVTALCRKEFQPYFTKLIFPTIGVITNTDKNRHASYPPHTDRARSIGINYYIDMGGENVQTVFYNKCDPPEEKTGGNVLPYETLSVDTQFKFLPNTWYAINTKQYHSVENIETTRCILSLSILDTDFSCLTNLVSSTRIEPVFVT